MDRRIPNEREQPNNDGHAQPPQGHLRAPSCRKATQARPRTSTSATIPSTEPRRARPDLPPVAVQRGSTLHREAVRIPIRWEAHPYLDTQQYAAQSAARPTRRRRPSPEPYRLQQSRAGAERENEAEGGAFVSCGVNKAPEGLLHVRARVSAIRYRTAPAGPSGIRNQKKTPNTWRCTAITACARV